jgi:dihydrofolate reductase
MLAGHRVEGYAIVSANGMIADASGTMPASIRIDADQKFLQREMDRAAVIVHGRHSHEGGPSAAKRKRIIVTGRIASLAPDPSQPNAQLWNPEGATFEQAIASSAMGPGPIAILGGTDVFGMFLPLYDAFHLTRAAAVEIPQGRPVFPQVGPQASPDDILRQYGLRPLAPENIDATGSVTLTTWERSRP